MNRYWNYRVMEFVTPDGEPWRAIHEVHYEDDRPVIYAEEAAIVMWNVDASNNDAALRILDNMRLALEKPVLIERDFQSPRPGERDRE